MNKNQCTSIAAKVGVTICVGAMMWGCSATDPTATASVRQAAKKSYDLDARRSLAVTDQIILERFSLERVLTQLISQSQVVGLSPTQLFNDWWDTQNPRTSPASVVTHCDDAELAVALNGFPYDCRPAPSEGYQSACDPFAVNSPCAYMPVGLFNRFDQAPENGAHCGEFRIVYAKEGGIINNRDRNLLIFEANMPNPLPNQGLKGCTKIAKVWADLTEEDEIEARADELEEFYFDGHGNIPAVISVDRFGDNSAGLGQIRTNQFVDPETGWQLREFKLIEDCSGATCTLLFTPVTAKVNAFGGLFDPGSYEPGASAFRQFFPTQVAALAAESVAAITMEVPDQFNTGRSISSTSYDEMKYDVNLGSGPSELRDAVQAALNGLGSTLSVDEILLRAQANSCAGCHRLNNNVDIGGGLTWPSAAGFVHVNERVTEVVDGVVRYPLSDALNDVFLPHRKTVIDDFLNDKPKVPKGPHKPIGGRNSHG